MAIKTRANSQAFIDQEAASCANNYLPVPIVVERAKDCLVWDADGKQYIDMMSAYSAVSHGHLHPRLVSALRRQTDLVAVTSRAYHGTTLGPFLAKLCAVSGFERALPMNTGAEAVETAIKAARRWGYGSKGIAPDQAEILVARNNFHGRTTTVISASSEPDYRQGYGPFTPGFRWFDFGDMASVRAATTPNTCAVLVEPIQGEAGIVLPPPGFFAELRAWCDRQQLLLVMDEVQSGLGRTGRWFAYEHEGIRPDALVLGKALGGGLLPLSAFVADRRVMDVFTPGSHGSTFGGNALAAAVGLEALQVIEDESLVARSAVLGQHLLQRLQALHSPLIRQVRGRGLWVGVEVDPALTSARRLVERLAEGGVLSKETHETVIRFAPPLTISRALIDEAVEVFREVLGEQPRGRSVALAANRPAQTRHKDSESPAFSPVDPVHLLMSPPDHFEVSYAINPWMEPAQWSLEAHRLARDARHGWAALKARYEALGARVTLLPPARGLPDMVFTANSALVLDGKVLLARFKHAERAGEEAHVRRLFERLQPQGEVQSLHTLPEDLCFEGAGDAIFDATRRVLWTGWGQRSSRGATQVIEELYGLPTLSLELTDPRYYHLDTCFCLLSGGEVVVHPQAFTPEGVALLKAVLGDQLMEAPLDDAEHLGVNSVCLGRDVVMCHCSEALEAQLQERGYQVHRVPLGAFNRSGGAAYCLTLNLSQRSDLPQAAPGQGDWPQAA